MTDSDLSHLLNRGETHVREVLLKYREKTLMPMYHLIGDEDVIIPCTWENDFQKELMVLAVKKQARDMKAFAVLFMAESWMATLDADAKIRPSQHPDRVEVVFIVASNGERMDQRFLRMIRDNKGRLTDLVIDFEGAEGAGGLMIDGIIEGPQGTMH